MGAKRRPAAVFNENAPMPIRDRAGTLPPGPPLLPRDLSYFEEKTRRLVPLLHGRRILLTGGTGFFGKWLVECLLHLSRVHTLDLELCLLTRDARRFAQGSPHLAGCAGVALVEGDARAFALPGGRLDYVLHAAADSVVPPGTKWEEQRDSIVEGTRHVLDLAGQRGAKRFLFVSSGAVYGPQPRTVPRVAEDDPWQPYESAYTAGKRAAEALCLRELRVPCILARAFAFLGPHLPLDAHFAAGNFLADALAGRPMEIRGDGTPLRSYLYAADLAVWLWTLLLLGEPGRAYNVGSDEPVSILELAQRTAAAVHPGLPIHVRGKPPTDGEPPPRYVPSVERARTELGLSAGIGLDEALRRTAEWHRLRE